MLLISCVLNQSNKHWLLSDALHLAISMSLKLKEDQKMHYLLNLNGRGFIVALELICLASNVRKEVCGVLNSFLSFWKKFDKRTHNMLALMLDTRLKSFRLVSSFIGHDQGVTIVEQYDTMSL